MKWRHIFDVLYSKMCLLLLKVSFINWSLDQWCCNLLEKRLHEFYDGFLELFDNFNLALFLAHLRKNIYLSGGWYNNPHGHFLHLNTFLKFEPFCSFIVLFITCKDGWHDFQVIDACRGRFLILNWKSSSWKVRE